MQNNEITCADARHLIHLSVGEDTLPEEETRLAEHLHTCAECRAYHAGMMSAMQVLEQTRESLPPEPMPRSLWPAMADQLKVRQAQMMSTPQGRRFNVSVAALCVCSLVLALVTAVQNLPSHEVQMMGGYSVMPARSVDYSADGQNSRLVQHQLPDGSWVLYDTVAKQFVPTILKSDNEDLNF